MTADAITPMRDMLNDRPKGKAVRRARSSASLQGRSTPPGDGLARRVVDAASLAGALAMVGVGLAAIAVAAPLAVAAFRIAGAGRVRRTRWRAVSTV